MNRKILFMGLLLTGLVLFVTATAVSGVINDESTSKEKSCNGLDPHGHGYRHGQGNGNHTGPHDGTGHHWGTPGPHGDCNQTEQCDCSQTEQLPG